MTSLIYVATRKIHADHVVSALISTGDMSSDTNWTDFTNGTTGGTVTITGGKLVVTQGSNSVWMGAYQAITTVVGEEYIAQVDVDVGTTSRLLVNSTGTPGGSGSTGDLGTDTSEDTTQTITFTATTTTTYIFLVQGAATTVVRSFDDAACQLTGTVYKDLPKSSFSEGWPLTINLNESLDGTPETIFHRQDQTYLYVSRLISRAELTSDYWYEMLASIYAVESFTFDAYGSISSPDNQVTAIVIPNSISITPEGNIEQYRVSFSVREL